MAYNDVQELRKRNLFPVAPITDITQNIDYGSGLYGPQEPPMSQPYEGIFNGPPIQSAPQPQAQQPEVGDPRNPNRIWDMINKIYTPETQSRDRLNAHLDAAPERESPSFARRLVAAGMGMGQKDPLPTMENVMYAPHMRNMQDWTAKVSPFQGAYATENNANVNERQLAGNAVTAQVNQDRYDDQTRVNEEKNRIAEKKNDDANEVAKTRAEAYAFAQRNPNLGKWDFSGPTIIVMGEDGIPRDTGIKSGHMTESDKITLQNQGRERVANISAQGGIRRAEIAAGASTSNARTRAGVTGTSTRTNTLEATRQRQERMREIFETSPELVKGVITKDGNGKYTLAPRPVEKKGGLFSSGITKEQVDRWDEIKQAVDPDYKPRGISPTGAPPVGTKPAPPPQKTGAAPQAPKEAFQPRGDYTPGSKGAKQDPAFVGVAKDIAGAVKGAATPPPLNSQAGNVYGQQVMTPEGPKTIPPGKVAIKDLTTGEIVQIPAENLQKALATKKYAQVK